MTNETRCDRPHPTVFVEVGENRAEIDSGLAPLIEQVWKAGIDTMMSCQETWDGIAWIAFDSVDDVLRFLDIVAFYEPGADTLFNRICDDLVGELSSPEWEFRFNPMPLIDCSVEQITGAPVSFHATIGVYFPQTDIPTLLNRLRLFNEHNSSFKRRESA